MHEHTPPPADRLAEIRDLHVGSCTADAPHNPDVWALESARKDLLAEVDRLNKAVEILGTALQIDSLTVIDELKRHAGDACLPIEDVERFLKRERDEYEARGQDWNTVDNVLDCFRLHMVTGTPLTEPRPEEGPSDPSVGRPGLTEAEELHAELARVKAEHEREMLKVIDERDQMHDLLDTFAYRVAPVEKIGEHSSGNDPWQNALELLTPHQP
ncbi:hypothetical protein FXF51_01770 [Nonomuraea sp. PA05]|uniref:hypothetical protein n=1 Tax=Nonomuraea sp. PA05 TaxID=2604466 RepID=UPI0011D62518|nr:hypothetical protein [Nonomuraea sp. PA05]TYB71190.1 hypothetical protein FXF51_01770 [Nonomuraea sp. PA05]